MENKIERILNQFIACQKLVVAEKEQHYLSVCKREHFKTFATNIVRFFFDEKFIEKRNTPSFEDEINIDCIAVFKKFLFLKNCDNSNETIKKIEKITLVDFLIVLGQRITSATIQDVNGIPPLDEKVFEASFELFNPQITKAVRAYEKHAKRTVNSFWKEIKGNPLQKEKEVKALLNLMLVEKTWWNVFYHYKHELVYEIRIPSGHGARWKKCNLEFIGFVEPFLNGALKERTT